MKPKRSTENSELFKELLGRNSRARVDGQLHLVDLLVDLLHEVNYKVNQLVLVHLLCVEVRHQEANVVALKSYKIT